MTVHFIGIGGAGMSGIAAVLHELGVDVRGSDLKASRYTRRLAETGVPVSVGHDAANLGDAAVVVTSSAISEVNPEVRAARAAGLLILRRAEMLARVMELRRGIAVAGTHGKTTTSSMISHVLRQAGMDPTFLVGGELNDIGSNVAFGDPDLAVAEADESDRSLLHLHPRTAIITNVEFDHPDFYSSLEDVRQTFSKFVGSLPEDGCLIACSDDPICAELAAEAPCPALTYGITSGGLRARILTSNSYVLVEDGEERGEVEIGVHGRHNVLNSLAAAATARWLGHDAYEAARSLGSFGGVRRRFQIKGERSEVRVVDDYAHHPTELSATLETARATSSNGGRIIAVFQPHRYSRTLKFHREFGEAFAAADAVLITDVYGAGEMPAPGVNGKLIVDAICETRPHPEVFYVPDQSEIPHVLHMISSPGDTVLTMGAGDISGVGDGLLELLAV